MQFTTRRRRSPLAVCAWATFALTLAATSADVLAAPEGARVFRNACAACHGVDGRGKTASEVGFDNPLPDFTDCDFASREADGDWSATIHGGGRARAFDRIMPAFGGALTEDEIAAVIAHLRTFCGDARWPRGELNVPRAMFTEKAFPEDEAAVTTSVVTDGPDSITHQFVWEKRFGMLNQVELGLPISRADLGGADGWQTGVGDLTVAVKHVLAHSAERGSILSVGGELTLPTGDDARGFGVGTTILESFVLFDRLLPHDSFLQLQASAALPRSSLLDKEIELRVAVGRTWATGGGFGRTWTPMLEVLSARPLVGGATTEWDVVPQLQASLSTRQHITASGGFRVPFHDHGGRPTELVFYLVWDWYDGGLREGW